MATAITGAKQTAMQRQPGKPSQSLTAAKSINFLVSLLTYLGQARQAALSKETLKVYAQELAGFAEVDVAAGIRNLALTPRGPGETAFPDLGTVIQAVSRVQSERLAKERQIAREAADRAWVEDRLAHPENYVSYAEIVADVLARRRNRA